MPGVRYSSLAAYSDLFQRLLDCGFLVDPASHVILEVNLACERVLAIPSEKMVGRALDQWIDPTARDDFGRALRVAMRRYYPRLFETMFRLPDQRGIPVEIQACPLKLSDGSEVLQIVARDISFRKDIEQRMHVLVQQLQASNTRLEHLSSEDEMTGLSNFRQFKTLLDQEHARSGRFGVPYAIVFCDIDHFKAYNDQNGHPAGDRLLRDFAAILRKCCRSTDHPTRYGGEEFAIVCAGVSWEGAAVLAERIRAQVEAAVFEHGTTQPGGKLTVSVGVASFPADGASPSEVLKAADEAVYHSKTSGRNQVTVAAKVPKGTPKAA
jgi:diguanylate cyclase (GGDEF)-like protein/PAS domain S-box-containing protein